MKIKILLIEDDVNLAENLSEILEYENYDVYHIVNGTKAVEVAKKISPDLVISDIMMPKKNGYEVIEEFQSNDSLKKIPFIFLSARIEMSDLRRGMELGADDYLFKPVKRNVLINAIETRLKKYRKLFTQVDHSVTNHVERKLNEKDSIFVSEGKDVGFIKINEIIAISASNQYTELFMLEGKRIVLRKSLNYWENLLSFKIFIRIHRSTIININHVVRVEKFIKGTYSVFMKNNPRPFKISRSYVTKLKDIMIG